MTLAGISIRRPVATTMITVSILLIGIIAMFKMKRELIPNMDVPKVSINATWSGAVAEDIETFITKEIETSLSAVEGIQKIETVSSYQSSKVNIEFKFGVNLNEKINEIQKEISRISSKLPSDSTLSIRKASGGSSNFLALVVFASPNKTALSNFIDQYLVPRLQGIEGIGDVSVFGEDKKQIQIQVDDNKLAAYNMSPMELYSLISGTNPTMPAGKISDGNKSIIIRFIGEINYIEQYENMIIKSNGNILRLKDVANVVLTNEDKSSFSYFNGKNSLTLFITKSSDGEAIKISKKIYEILDELSPLMPNDTEKKVVVDTSEFISSSISAVFKSALQGLVLATIILFLFLKNVRTTLLITIALPVAIIATFAFLSLNGTSLNLISLMGLSIGVGMLTDNSVVVIDNIYRHITELDKSLDEATEGGANEVTTSIIASSLTTMVVFIPILFIPGMAREQFKDMSFSIIFSNIAALLVSITLIPMLANKFLKKEDIKNEDGKIFSFIKNKYLNIINFSIKNKFKTFIITVFVFIFSMIVAPKFIKFQFMPIQDQGTYSINAELPEGTDLTKADKVAKEIENIVKNNSYTQSYSTIVQQNKVSVNVDIGKKGKRNKSVFDLLNDIRPQFKNILDARISFATSFRMDSHKSIEFIIKGDNLEEIKNLSNKIYKKMGEFPEVVDLSSTVNSGATELRIEFDRDKIKMFGINPTTIARTISFYILGGDRSNPSTIKTENEEIDILVRLPIEKRSDIDSLKQINIKIGDNNFIKLGDVVKFKIAETSTEIRKNNKIYSVSISANDSGVGIKNIQNKFVETFKSFNPANNISYTWGGDSKNMIEFMSQLKLALMISLFLIYALLASQFESFLLPIIIIGSIPLAIIGVFWGLIILRQPLDIMSMIGIILLAGIVVNNAIVLIDFIKILRSNNFEKEKAVVISCETRLRPILMTTLTTVLGMVPLALGIGEGSEMYKGMALAVILGLTTSTILTLVIIPILYIIVDDLTNKVKRTINKLLKNY